MLGRLVAGFCLLERAFFKPFLTLSDSFLDFLKYRSVKAPLCNRF